MQPCKLREQLLYNVSHELRAPLAVLDNALDILASDFAELSAEEFRHLVGSARHTARQLHGLMEDLLSAGSIQSGRFTIHAQPTSLWAILNEALDTAQVELTSQHQSVECRVTGDSDYVLADQHYSCRVLVNPLSNASKYSPPDTMIRIRAVKTGNGMLVAVEDRGPGIPADQQASVFERFYRSRTVSEQPGIGLGLAIVKGIIEAHGGTIGIDSKEGSGTRIWFTLPVAEREDASTHGR